MNNWMTALHHRAAALSRGLPPDLERLTEDHGVCLSSCLDYWEDDLVLQAFNRGLILAPQLYGNPWLLRDDEFPLLARIFTLHRKYRDILVQGLLLPEETCGPNAVSRGDGSTRLITLRNLTWKPADYSLDLDEQIGLENNGRIEVRRLHPTEEILGRFDYGSRLTMTVEPFRSCLLIVSSRTIDEPTVRGAPFQVTRNMAGKPVELNILGWPGGSVDISLADASQYSRVLLDGKEDTILSGGGTRKVTFPGRPLTEKILRNVADFNEVPLDSLDWRPLYEATVFSADNNALEVRSLERSGWSSIPQVRAAQEAFFSQPVFVQRGVWDKNLFDGSLETGFWPSKKYNRPVVIEGGCLRLDLGKITDLDKIVIKVGDTFSLHPLLKEEGNHVEVSDDLIHWRTITYLAGLVMEIPLSRPVRYLRFKYFPSRILEIEGYKDGRMVDRGTWRASNLFAHPDRLQAAKIWRAQLQLQEIAPHSYLCIALNGEHGEEGAYVGAKIDGILRGAPDRAVSYPSNTWEYLVGGSDKNYTYYIPLRSEDIGKLIELYVIGFNEEKLDFRPEAYINAYPVPYKSIPLLLDRKSK